MTSLFRVLFEDDRFIAFDKPSGLLVAPDRWDKNRQNLMNLVHEQLSAQYFNAHRLDRDTSGIVLCAKDREALTAICRMFQRGEVQKVYCALLRGVPRDFALALKYLRKHAASDRNFNAAKGDS